VASNQIVVTKIRAREITTVDVAVVVPVASFVPIIDLLTRPSLC
jgi:hypothetical protein